MKFAKSMAITILCACAILFVGYVGIVFGGESLLRLPEGPQPVAEGENGSMSFYSSLEDDIELYPWNYYRSRAEGGSSVDGTDFALAFKTASGLDLEKDVFYRLIAIAADVGTEEVSQWYERQQATILGGMTQGQDGDKKLELYFYEDTIQLGNRPYLVRISCGKDEILSFSCSSARGAESGEGSGLASDGERANGNSTEATGNGAGASSNGTGTTGNGAGANSNGTGTTGNGTGVNGTGDSEGTHENGNDEGAAGDSEGSGVVSDSAGTAGDGNEAGANGDGEGANGGKGKEWEENSAHLAEWVQENPNAIKEYYVFMQAVRSVKGGIWSKAQSWQWYVEWMAYVELMAVLQQFGGQAASQPDAQDSAQFDAPSSIPFAIGVDEEVDAIIAGANTVEEGEEEEIPTQLIEMDEGMFLLMEGDASVGLYYDVLEQRVVGFHYLN